MCIRPDSGSGPAVFVPIYSRWRALRPILLRSRSALDPLLFRSPADHQRITSGSPADQEATDLPPFVLGLVLFLLLVIVIADLRVRPFMDTNCTNSHESERASVATCKSSQLQNSNWCQETPVTSTITRRLRLGDNCVGTVCAKQILLAAA